VKVRRDRKRLCLRPVTVLVSEQDIDYLVARDYELARTDNASISMLRMGPQPLTTDRRNDNRRSHATRRPCRQAEGLRSPCRRRRRWTG
jgi:hypothetical protein